VKITKIILENFQSHQYTELDIDAAITLITGSSDSGKSSLVRALRWVFFNRAPKGNFIQDKKKTARVTLIYDTGDVLIRERDSKVNQYRLNDDVYKALKTDVPVQISNFHKVTVDNCQWQLHHLFLLDETPGLVAKRLNEVADLSIMTETSIVVKALVREAEAKVTEKEAVVLGLTDQLQDLDWVSDAKERLAAAVKLRENFEVVQTDLGILRESVVNVEATQAKLGLFPDLSGLVVVNSTLEQCQDRAGLFQKISGLQEILQKISGLQETLKQLPEIALAPLNSTIDLIQQRDTLLESRNTLALVATKTETLQKELDVLPNVDVKIDVESYENARKDIVVAKSTLRGVITTVTKWQGNLKAVEISLLEAEEAYADFKQDLGLCPVCGNKFQEVAV
jgi:exonuclease SbcC